MEDKTTFNPFFGFFMLIKRTRQLATLGSKQQFLVDWLYSWGQQVKNYIKRILSQSPSLISLSNYLFSRNGVWMVLCLMSIVAIQGLLLQIFNISQQYSLSCHHLRSRLTICMYKPIPFQIQFQDLHHKIMSDLEERKTVLCHQLVVSFYTI